MQKKILAVLLASMFVGNAWAEDKTISISAQDMPGALHSLAGQTGIQLLFTADDLKNIQAKEISGSMSEEEALKRLLEGTNYTYRTTGNGTYVLQRKGAALMLNEVTVTATRTERNVADVPASVSVLTAKQLKTKHRQNIFEALRDEEGLDFNDQAGVAHQTMPDIRGVGESSVGSPTQVMVDGISTDAVTSNLMGHGGLNFISMQDVERVEIVRGPVSALYGPSTVGGVINIIPKRWKGEAGMEMNASYGSHNTRTIGAAVGAAKENFDVRLSVYDAQSDGYLAQPMEDGWGQKDAGPRDWKDNKIGLIVGVRPADKHEVILALQSFGTRSAWYGGRPNDRQNLDGQTATLGYRFAANENTQIKADLRKVSLKQKAYFDLDTFGMAGDFSPGYLQGNYSETTKFQFQLDTRPVEGNQLTAGYAHDSGSYEMRDEDISAGGLFGPSPVTVRKDKSNALFIQDEHNVGKFTLTGGLRYDRFQFEPDTSDGAPKNGQTSVENVVNPRLGGRFHINDSTSIYASAGTAYLPAYNAFKFVQPSTTRVNNPDLKPETSVTYEIGMNNQFDRGALRASLYRTNYKDKIEMGTDQASSMDQWQNIAVRKVTGIEIAMQGDLENGWQPYANFSYTKAQDQATAGAAVTQARKVAPRKLNFGVTYAPDSTWSATLNGRAVSGVYLRDLTAAQWSGGYFIADAKLSSKLPFGTDKWEAFLAINNLTDKKYQPWRIGEWTAGRTFTVGVCGKI